MQKITGRYCLCRQERKRQNSVNKMRGVVLYGQLENVVTGVVFEVAVRLGEFLQDLAVPFFVLKSHSSRFFLGCGSSLQISADFTNTTGYPSDNKSHKYESFL
jgi:hypothetical protein